MHIYGTFEQKVVGELSSAYGRQSLKYSRTMRSHYDDFAAGETKKLSSTTIDTTNYININNNNNNNSCNNNSNGAIPYHARENSLPFSYGQINKTSTPLRPTNTNAVLSSTSSTVSRNYSNNKNGNEYDFDFDFDFDLNSTGRSNTGIGLDYGYGKTTNHNNYNYNNNNNNSNSNKSALNGSGSSGGGGVGVGGGGVKDVSFNLLTQSERDRDCYNIYGGLNSEKYLLNESCKPTVKYEYNNQTNNNNNNSGINFNNFKTADDIDASMIKSQPRLTSPLLVRKTLSNGSNNNNNNSNSRSPTRSTANTIANTYHYSFGNGNNSNNNNYKNGSFIGNNNFDKFNVNGNINNNDSSYGHKTMYGSGGGGSVGSRAGDILNTIKTPARHDFDELLRERREKVYNEYRTTATTTYDLSSSPKVSPVPPPRRFANGTVQLPSTLPSSLSQKSSSSLYPPQLPNRSQSQNSKYNYDIEFNLNLNERYGDEVDNVEILRRRTNTIDSSTKPHKYLQQKQQQLQQHQQQQQQLYQTRDIPLASSHVERNYHTISSSSSASTHAKNSNNNNNNYNYNYNSNNRETLSPTSMLDIYSTPYDERIGTYNKQRTNMLQPLEATTATTTLQRTQRSTDYTTYGNGNMFGHEHTNLGQKMTDKESSPIYATSTKKVTSSLSSAATAAGNASAAASPSYRSSNNAIISTASTLAVADYPSPMSARPETPAFPVTPRTPFSGVSSNGYASQTATLSKQINGNYQQHQPYQPANATNPMEHNYSAETIYGNSYRSRLNSSLSVVNSEPQEVAAHLVKFAKDSSKFWYKPNLSRDEAISLLINAPPGTFLVRDSTTYKNAYGLVLRVAQPPPGSVSTGKPDELVRHFLIEPTTRGVRLKGCANEPVFTSLSALVYEHSINQLALPCLLQIPERDLLPPLVEHTPAQKQLLTQGAACNVLWLFSCDTESLTGEEAIRKAIRQMYALPALPTPTEVHFKVTQQGITLTDNTRKKFFRKHYTADIISYCAIDPDHRLWTMQEHGNDNTTVVGALKKTIFAFVARRSPSSKDNQCHIFCDLAINQPASAIVSFVNKTLPTEKQKNYVL